MVSRSTVTQVWSISINTILITSISTKRTFVHICEMFNSIYYTIMNITITMMMISIECITIVTWTIVATNSIITVLFTSSTVSAALVNVLITNRSNLSINNQWNHYLTSAVVAIISQSISITTCTVVTSNIVFTILFTSTIIWFTLIDICTRNCIYELFSLSYQHKISLILSYIHQHKNNWNLQ